MSDSSKIPDAGLDAAPDTPSIAFADRVTRIAPSPTVAISTLALDLRAAGRDVIGLAVGEPDFETPPHVKEAAIRAIHDGHTRYTQVDGIPELKEAVAEKFRRENGLDVSAANISVGTGGKQVLFNALMATVQEGDEVIIPAPYWVSFAGIVEVAGGRPVFVRAGFEDGLKLTPDTLAAAITPKSRWVIIRAGTGEGDGEAAVAIDLLARQRRAIRRRRRA